MQHPRIKALVILLAGVGASCVPQDPESDPHSSGSAEVATTSQALNGTVTFEPFPEGDCKQNEAAFRSKFTSVFQNILLPQVTNFNPLLECLKEGILSGETASVFKVTSPEIIMERMRANLPTKIACQNGDGGCWFSGSNPVQGGDVESFVCSYNYAHRSDAEVAFTSLHEIAHRFYNHPSGEREEYAGSVNQMLAKCLDTILDPNVETTPELPTRSSLPFEAGLAEVGNEGGSPLSPNSCGTFEVVAGFKGSYSSSSGSFLKQLAPVCVDVWTSTKRDLPLQGSAGTTAFRNECMEGEVAVGVHGNTGTWLHSIGNICALQGHVELGNPHSATDSAQGALWGMQWERRCPPFMALKSVRMRAGDFVDRIELRCQDIRQPRRIENLVTSWVGEPAANQYDEVCAGRAVMSSLYTRAGDRLDRIGGLCTPVSPSNGASAAVSSDSTNTYRIPSHGGAGGSDNYDACVAVSGTEVGAGAIVGLRVFRDSSTILGVQARCANIERWSSSATSNTYLRNIRGGSSSTFTDLTCPQGKFAVGYRVHSDTLVKNIALVCRGFGS